MFEEKLKYLWEHQEGTREEIITEIGRTAYYRILTFGYAIEDGGKYQVTDLGKSYCKDLFAPTLWRRIKNFLGII